MVFPDLRSRFFHRIGKYLKMLSIKVTGNVLWLSVSIGIHINTITPLPIAIIFITYFPVFLSFHCRNVPNRPPNVQLKQPVQHRFHTWRNHN